MADHFIDLFPLQRHVRRRAGHHARRTQSSYRDPGWRKLYSRRQSNDQERLEEERLALEALPPPPERFLTNELSFVRPVGFKDKIFHALLMQITGTSNGAGGMTPDERAAFFSIVDTLKLRRAGVAGDTDGEAASV